MADYIQNIRVTATVQDAEKALDRLGSRLRALDAATRISLPDLSKAANLERTLRSVDQINKAVTALGGAFRSISSPGRGELGDAFGVAAEKARKFYAELSQGKTDLANTTSGLLEQVKAFRTLAANIDSVDDRFQNYVQGAQAAQDKLLKSTFAQFEALRKLYGSGLTGQGDALGGNKVGLAFFDKLKQDIPQTTAALQAYKAELKRVQDLIGTRGDNELASVAVAKELLDVETKLRDIEQDRMEIAAAVNRELNSQVQGSLSRMQGSKPNPLGITADETNAVLDKKAQDYLTGLKDAEQVKQALAKLDERAGSALDDVLGINRQLVNTQKQLTGETGKWLRMMTPKDFGLSKQLALPSSEMLNSTARGLQQIKTAEDKHNDQLKESAERLQQIDRLEESRARRAKKLQGIADYYGDQNIRTGRPGDAGYAPGTQYSRPIGPQPAASSSRQRNRGGFDLANAAVSGAFPLLFGGGPGAVLGGFAGGGFSGLAGNPMFGIVTSALGTVLDQFAAAAIDMGKSLRDPITNFQKLADAGLLASKSQEYYIQRLIEVGRITEATAVIQGEMVKKIGVDGVNDLQQVSVEADNLSKAWAELSLSMQGVIAGPLGEMLRLFAGPVKTMNGVNQMAALEKDLKAAGLGGKFDEFRKRDQAFRSLGPEEGTKARLKLIEEYRKLLPPPALKNTKTDPEAAQKAAEAQLSAAERAEALRRQGIQLENQATDLRLNIEDQVYGFRKRAADLERANIDLRRSLEDEIFRKRQDIARQEIENDRKRAQLAIERTDLGLAGMRGFSNEPGQEIANRLLDATRQYIRSRAEGEADLRSKERTFTVEMEDLKRSSEKLRFEVGRKVADLQRQADEYTRDVSRFQLTTQRAIFDLEIAAADYRVAKAKEAIALETDAAQRLQMTNAASTSVTGGGGGGAPMTAGGYIDKEVLRKWLISQGMGRTSGDFTNAGHRTPNHMLNAMDMGFTAPQYDRNYVQKTIEMERKLRATGAFGSQLFGPERDPSGHATHLHVPTPGGRVPLTPGLAALMGGKTAATTQVSPIFQRPGAAVPAPSTSGLNAARAGAAAAAAGAPAGIRPIDVSGLLSQFARFDAQLIKTKAQALELDKVWAQMTDLQRQQAFQDAISQTVQELNAPIDALLKTQQDQLAYQREYGELIQSGILPQLAEQIVKIREQVKLELQKLDFAVLQYKAQIAYLKSKGLETSELEKQLEILEAQRGVIEGKGKQAEEGAKQAQSPGQRLQDAYTNVKGQLNELMDPVNQITKGAEAIGSAFGTAFKDVASGAKTAQQALADAFQGIANHFLDMAAQMIAKYIEMQVIGLAMNFLGSAAGGFGGFSGAGPVAMPGAGVGGGGSMFMPGAPSFFATGGFVTGPTNAVIGEGGESEYVIPSSKMGAAMSNYRAGKRGAGVLEGGEAGGGSGGGGTFTLETVVINRQEYATIEQVREMGAAATRRGAEGGHAKSMGTLRNSRSQRSRLGMR